MVIFMKIKFKNGSEINILDTKDGSKRGYIRGRRLTDKESAQMLDNEIFQAEERTSKLVKNLDGLRIIGVDISHTSDQSSTIYVTSKGRIMNE